MNRDKRLDKGLETGLDKGLEKSLGKMLEKSPDSNNCAEFGPKRASTINLTYSIAVVAMILLAVPLPLHASPKTFANSPEDFANSPENFASSPKSFAASSKSFAASSKSFATSSKPRATKGAVGGFAGGRSAWCHAIVSQPLPQGKAVGIIGGQPFKPEFIQWNSYSITLKQNRKRYCKVVINMMRSQKPLCNLAFTSDSNNRPHIYVYTRSANSEPIKEQHYTSKDGYGLKLSLLSPIADDWIPGSLSLRLPDGSFVAGSFKAEKAPRIIWDDESVNP